MKRHFVLLASVFSIGLGGCGIGLGATVHPTTIEGPRLNMSGTLIAPTLRFYDSTGYLLAILANANNQWTARNNALAYARPGETVTYYWQPVAPVPGMLTTMDVSWGSTDSATASQPGISGTIKGKLEFMRLELNVDLWEFRISDQFSGQLTLGALWRDYKMTSGFGSESENWIGMPFGFRLAHAIDFGDHELVTGAFAVVDPLISGLTALLSEGSWFWGRFGVRGDLSLLEWLGVSAEAYYEVAPLGLGDTDQDGFTFTITLNGFYTPEKQTR